jgi:choline dehydrogenase-like flavoprotein
MVTPHKRTTVFRTLAGHLPNVSNPDHRTHDIKNLFLCDGRSLVTSGRGQPTMTIQASAYRAADRITVLARRGDLRS